jgi:hypothetical protein
LFPLNRILNAQQKSRIWIENLHSWGSSACGGVIKPEMRRANHDHRESLGKKRTLMKSQKKVGLLVVMAVLGAMVAIGPAHAQSESRVSVNIPFDFVVGNSALKAGVYRIETLEPGVLTLGSAGGQKRFALVATDGNAASRNGDAYVVFTRYGSEVFLDKVVFSSDSSYDLVLTSREKELIANVGSAEEDAVVIQQSR